MNIERETFLELPTAELAELVRSSGSQVCVFPINGTRRWFLLEHGHENHADWAEAYAEITGRRHIEMYQLMFEHGLDTLVTPIFGGELLNRGDEYMEQMGLGMARLTRHPDFLTFYQKYNVRVHFYGDYRKKLSGTPYAYLCDSFDHIAKNTARNTRHRLFYGVFADDATESIAELSLRYYQNNNRLPTRPELIKLYYGETIGKANLFIGFGKFNVFDYPMLGLGDENLYFTAAPSLYLEDRQLRDILYDHLYLRPVQDPDYTSMPADDWEAMRHFYKTNREVTFGVGEMCAGIWYPKSSIKERG